MGTLKASRPTSPSSTYVDSYWLANAARSKLTKEVNKADYNLRILVSHANLLDSVMDHLMNSSAKRTTPVSQSQATPGGPIIHKNTSYSELQTRDKNDGREYEDYEDNIDSDSDSCSTCSSGSDDDDYDFESHENYLLTQIRSELYGKEIKTPQKASASHEAHVTFDSKPAKRQEYYVDADSAYTSDEEDDYKENYDDYEVEYDSDSDDEYMTLYEAANIHRYSENENEDDDRGEQTEYQEESINDLVLTRVSSHSSDLQEDDSQESGSTVLPPLTYVSSSSEDEVEDYEPEERSQSGSRLQAYLASVQRSLSCSPTPSLLFGRSLNCHPQSSYNPSRSETSITLSAAS
ncbi:hypothetical protein V1511DRAFT_501224 [Dipodascopsis uninucleata]